MSEPKPKKFTIIVEIPTVDQILENLRKSFPVVKFEVGEEKKEVTKEEPQ